MRRGDPNSYWTTYRGKVGIRYFPRAGSSTISEVYGRGHNFGDFLATKKKVCVVRNPWDRLMSVYNGMVRPREKFLTYKLPKVADANDFIAWLLDQDPYDTDPHVTPMWAFLEGMWKPKPEEVYEFTDFFANPPHGLPSTKVHLNETKYPPGGKVGVHEYWYDKWYLQLGQRDFDLLAMAECKKAPL